MLALMLDPIVQIDNTINPSLLTKTRKFWGHPLRNWTQNVKHLDHMRKSMYTCMELMEGAVFFTCY